MGEGPPATSVEEERESLTKIFPIDVDVGILEGLWGNFGFLGLPDILEDPFPPDEYSP